MPQAARLVPHNAYETGSDPRHLRPKIAAEYRQLISTRPSSRPISSMQIAYTRAGAVNRSARLSRVRRICVFILLLLPPHRWWYCGMEALTAPFRTVPIGGVHTYLTAADFQGGPLSSWLRPVVKGPASHFGNDFSEM